MRHECVHVPYNRFQVLFLSCYEVRGISHKHFNNSLTSSCMVFIEMLIPIHLVRKFPTFKESESSTMYLQKSHHCITLHLSFIFLSNHINILHEKYLYITISKMFLNLLVRPSGNKVSSAFSGYAEQVMLLYRQNSLALSSNISRNTSALPSLQASVSGVRPATFTIPLLAGSFG